MTILAHNAAVLRIGTDSWRLFADESENYRIWLDEVVKMVSATHRAAEERARNAR